MTETARHKLPLIEAGQAQKHVTHNEAITMLDLLTGIIPVLDRDLTAPPGGESDGDVYILGGTGTGDWDGYAANDLALRIDGNWRRSLPSNGMMASLDDEDGALVYYTGSAWTPPVFDGPTGLQSGFRNLLINPRGLVNQRGYASGAATSSAGQYAVDRWRVVTSGEALSWSEADGYRTFTAPAGGVEQEIDGDNIVTGAYVLSWNGTANATVDGDAVANGGTVALTGGTNATVKFSGGTFALPQFERGAVASAFEVRPMAREEELCRYYYEVLGDGSVANPAIIIGKMQTTTIGAYVVVFAMKRINPAVTVSAASDWYVNTRSINDVATAFNHITNALQRNAALVQFTIATPRGAGEGCLLYGQNSGAKMFIDAEL